MMLKSIVTTRKNSAGGVKGRLQQEGRRITELENQTMEIIKVHKKK